MDYKEFMSYFDSKGTSKKEAIIGLQNYVNEFPYFQTAQSLLAKALHEQEHVKYDKQLKIAAAYCGDRRSLYHLINNRPSGVFVETTNTSPFISHSPQILVVEEKNPAPVPLPRAEENAINENVFVSTKEVVENNLSEELPLGNFNYTEEEESGTTYQSYSSSRSITPEQLPKIVIEEKGVSLENTEQLLVEATITQPPIELKVEEKNITTEAVVNTDDPREILRQRLKEILNQKDSSETELSPIEVKETVVTLDHPEEKVEEATIVNFDGDKKIDSVKQIDSELPTVEEPTINEEVIPIRSYSKAEEIINELSKDAENVKDDVAKGEFEYALETTIIDSLEKLPIIDQSKIDKPAVALKQEIKEVPSTEFSFFDWLKKSSTNDFGNVEEVHAYDNDKGLINHQATEIQIASESIDKIVISKSEIEEKDSTENIKDSATIKNDTEVLINKFIATEPRIVASKTEFYNPAKQAQRSIIEDEDLVSETLAKIYSLQGAHLKARSAYQKLILLHPEKKAYFAALIEEIDNNYNNPNKQDL